MEKRVLIAVLLSFLVLYAYQAMFPPPPETGKPAQASKAATAPNASAPAPANPPAASPSAPAALEPAPEIVVENADVRAVFSTRGAVITSWTLKKYRDDHGQPYELIAGHAPANSPKPLGLALDDAALSANLTGAIYTVKESRSR